MQRPSHPLADHRDKRAPRAPAGSRVDALERAGCNDRVDHARKRRPLLHGRQVLVLSVLVVAPVILTNHSSRERIPRASRHSSEVMTKLLNSHGVVVTRAAAFVARSHPNDRTSPRSPPRAVPRSKVAGPLLDARSVPAHLNRSDVATWTRPRRTTPARKACTSSSTALRNHALPPTGRGLARMFRGVHIHLRKWNAHTQYNKGDQRADTQILESGTHTQCVHPRQPQRPGPFRLLMHALPHGGRALARRAATSARSAFCIGYQRGTNRSPIHRRASRAMATVC